MHAYVFLLKQMRQKGLSTYKLKFSFFTRVHNENTSCPLGTSHSLSGAKGVKYFLGIFGGKGRGAGFSFHKKCLSFSPHRLHITHTFSVSILCFLQTFENLSFHFFTRAKSSPYSSVPARIFLLTFSLVLWSCWVTGRFGPIPVRTPGRFGPIPFRSGGFGLGRFGPISGVGRFGPISGVGRFGPILAGRIGLFVLLISF